MDVPSPPPVPSLVARAKAMRQKNARFARRIGMMENMSSQSLDGMQLILLPEAALLQNSGLFAPSLETVQDLRRDPIDLADLSDPITKIPPK